MTSKEQVTIPVEIRRRLAIEPGDQLLFEADDEGGARWLLSSPGRTSRRPTDGRGDRRLNVDVVEPA